MKVTQTLLRAALVVTGTGETVFVRASNDNKSWRRLKVDLEQIYTCSNGL